ncbi:MAG TPA: DHA2 family efflux MFS transporter permease subunit, partial [Nocardioides sp.]|nr:DHA2 family efflux MFS transporter permease subunit [Nocardioides sp.]
MTQPAPVVVSPVEEKDAWPALFALCLGFFMILVDSTIVSVATPAIISDLHADVNAVVWVTSAYLLAYAVPVLITGRLGDRFGPKRLYMTGLTVFTLASLWCGLTGTVELLIVARVVQGLGASMMTPQTMAIITRIFPAARRGTAMALWGATAGVATLVGPILGGILVDAAGWEWIFFINVPVGMIGLVLAARLVPTLETHSHRFDWLGVALSGVGMFLLVFGIQEGHQYNWSPAIWAMIGSGVVVLGLFVFWQARNTREPLVPLALFRDRNFSLANVAISVMGFAITALAIPIMLWAQVVRGLSPTRSALLLVPMAIMTILLARPVGQLTDRAHPRYITGFGFAATIVSLVWLSREMTPDVAIAQIIGPMVLLGIGNAFIWAPNSATATRNLPVQQAGAGAGIYNATRQVGAVLGSAAIAVLIDARLAAEGLPAFDGTGS